MARAARAGSQWAERHVRRAIEHQQALDLGWAQTTGLSSFCRCFVLVCLMIIDCRRLPYTSLDALGPLSRGLLGLTRVSRGLM